MKSLASLVKREWMQHRLAWTLMAVLPTLLAALVLSVGHIDVAQQDSPEPLPLAMTLAALGGSIGVHLLMAWIASIIIVAGVARRDHADRSIEFWLSLPTGHTRSLAVPLLVHLIAVPLAALAIGLLGGVLVSFVLVARVETVAAWLALPWPGVLAAALSIAARLAVGLVLGTLWLAPLMGLLVLLSAWLGRWGLVVLALGLGLGSQVLEKLLGQPLLGQWVDAVFSQAATALVNASGKGSIHIDKSSGVQSALGVIPQWAAKDALLAVGQLPSALFVGGLLLAAACFLLLVLWRRQGAGSGG